MGEPAHGEWADGCGRASGCEGKLAAAVTYFIRWSWWLPAISGGEPVDRESVCCHDGHAWQARGDEPAPLSRGGAGTRDGCHSDRFACRRHRVLSLAQTERTIGQLPPVQSTNSPTGSWHFESQDGKMELVAAGMSAMGVRCQQSNPRETLHCPSGGMLNQLQSGGGQRGPLQIRSLQK